MIQLTTPSTCLEPIAAAIPTRIAITALMHDAAIPTVMLTDKPLSERISRNMTANLLYGIIDPQIREVRQ